MSALTVRKVAFVPVSGWNYNNMLESDAHMPWLKGWKVICKDGNAYKITQLSAHPRLCT